MMSKFYFALVLVLTLVPGPFQAPVDFSGTWKMDPKKSLAAGIAEHTLVIVQNDVFLTMDSPGWKTKLVYKLDGTETIDKRATFESRTRSRWDSKNLVIQNTRVIQHADGGSTTYVTTDTYDLVLPDQLVIHKLVKSPRGEQAFKIVYERVR